jgi:hypothetical protein
LGAEEITLNVFWKTLWKTRTTLTAEGDTSPAERTPSIPKCRRTKISKPLNPAQPCFVEPSINKTNFKNYTSIGGCFAKIVVFSAVFRMI